MAIADQQTQNSTHGRLAQRALRLQIHSALVLQQGRLLVAIVLQILSQNNMTASIIWRYLYRLPGALYRLIQIAELLRAIGNLQKYLRIAGTEHEQSLQMRLSLLVLLAGDERIVQQQDALPLVRGLLLELLSKLQSLFRLAALKQCPRVRHPCWYQMWLQINRLRGIIEGNGRLTDG